MFTDYTFYNKISFKALKMEEVISKFKGLLTESKISQLNKFCQDEENSEQVNFSVFVS